MKSVGDIARLRDATLEPSADATVFHRTLGPPGDASAGWSVECVTNGTAYESAQVELFHGQFSGIAARLRVAVVTSWMELDAVLGESELMAAACDDWAGPMPHRFRWSASDHRIRGHMILLVAQPDPTRESPPEEVRVVGFIIRRATGETK